ncbi:MAG: hypothetical protein ABI778_03375 [Ignavibacteriota bacterium]
MNSELLKFMDGSLGPDQEAELLHRLSVSPERREILRSFFNMKVLFERDRNSIAVPYAAEQKLWASLGQLMPPIAGTAIAPTAEVLEAAAVTASRSGMFNSFFAAASVAVICLLIGLGSGYFVGKNSNSNELATERALPSTSSSVNADQFASAAGNVATSNSSATTSLEQTSHRAVRHSSSNVSEAPLNLSTASDAAVTTVNLAIADDHSSNSVVESVPAMGEFASVSPKEITPTSMIAHVHDPSQFSLRSPFDPEEANAVTPKTFLQKFEFYFNEGVGVQFPNNAATKVSMPVVTNSSISAIWQGFANTQGILSHLWFGGSFGTANVTQKKLRLDLDPVQKNYVMVPDLVHVQTTWYGGLLQYRQPISRKLALSLSGSLANSSVGTILGGEIGAHFDATSDVGFVVGVRGTHITYSIDQQQQELLSQGTALGLSIPADAQGSQLSYNFEISSGIYFHF